MKAIIRKQKERAVNHSKRSAFRVRVQPVAPAKIKRHIKEHSVSTHHASEYLQSDNEMDVAGTFSICE
jgi:hypothetical protein